MSEYNNQFKDPYFKKPSNTYEEPLKIKKEKSKILKELENERNS